MRADAAHESARLAYSPKVRVRFKCPKCAGDVAIASTWCRACLVEREDWVTVGRWMESR